jgi:hypothetical protein
VGSFRWPGAFRRVKRPLPIVESPAAAMSYVEPIVPTQRRQARRSAAMQRAIPSRFSVVGSTYCRRKATLMHVDPTGVASLNYYKTVRKPRRLSRIH